MHPDTPLPTELKVLAWSIALLVVHMLIQGATALREQGFGFNAGPRDERPTLGRIAGRAQRTFDNFKETYPVFIALALCLVVTGRNGGVGATGAWIWLLARLAYIPMYLFGVPWVRTLCWLAAGIGLAMMLRQLL